MVTINIGRKEAVFFAALVVIFLGIGFGIAYGGNQPDLHGHDAGELEIGDGELEIGDVGIRKGSVVLASPIDSWVPVKGNLHKVTGSVTLSPPMENNNYEVILIPQRGVAYTGDSGDEAAGFFVENKTAAGFDIKVFSSATLNDLDSSISGTRRSFNPFTEEGTREMIVNYVIIP